MKKTFIHIFAIILAAFSFSGCAGKMPPNMVNSPGDMKGRNIGAVVNTPATSYAEDYGTRRDYTSAETMLVDLRNGGLDCAIMDDSAAKANVPKVPGLKILPQPLIKADFCFAIAKENPDLTKAVNSALKTIRDNGTLKKIIDGYISGSDYRYASPENADLSAGTLTLAVDGKFPPYSVYDGNGNTTGLDIDVARAVCDILHVQMKISVVDKDSLITDVQYGKADLALGGLARNDSDAKLVDFSDSYTRCTMVVVVRN